MVILISQKLALHIWTAEQRQHLGDCLHGRSFDIASVVERAKHQHAFEYFTDVQHSSLHQ